MQKIVNIPVDFIYAHPRNPRKSLGDLTELADSIREQGILQNLTVITPAVSYITGVPTPIEHRSEPTYTVVIGHRRLAAAKMAGLKEVPCIVTEMTEKEQIAVMLLENIQRRDLTIVEESEGFRQLRFDMGVSVEELSKKTGYGQSKIRRRLKIAELPEDAVMKSLELNATLEDIIAVSELENEDNRIKALQSAGTGNFKWTIQNLKDNEQCDKQIPVLREKLLEVAKEIVLKDDEYIYSHPDYKHLTYQYCINLPLKDGIPDDIRDGVFKDVSGYHGDYYLRISRSGISVYIDSQYLDKAPADTKFEEARQKDTERRKKLVALSESMEKKRMSFLCEYKIEEPGDWCHSLLQNAVMNEYYIDGHIYEKLTEMSEPSTLSRKSLYLWYSLKAYDGYDDWQGNYTENKELDEAYEEIAKMGYEESEEETAWRDGSHELYGEG